MRTRYTLTILSVVAAMLLALVLPAMAQDEASTDTSDAQTDVSAASERDLSALRSAWSPRSRTLTVTHGPLDVALVASTSSGHQLGDVRVASTELTSRDGQPVGWLDLTLTTTSIDVPAAGDERRIESLVFDLGRAGQVSVLGSAHYPATGTRTARPIIGGSGRFDGASGSAVSAQLEDGSWVHALRFHQSRADRLVERATRERVREGIREWRQERARIREERRADRAEARDERKAAQEVVKAERKAEREAAKAERAAAKAERAAATDAPDSEEEPAA